MFKNKIVLGFVFVFSVVILVTPLVTYHDCVMIINENNNAKQQYFIQSTDNMSGQEKYDLIQSVCYTSYNNKSVHDEFWVERNTDKLVEQCIVKLIE